jgi:hypothetical protein
MCDRESVNASKGRIVNGVRLKLDVKKLTAVVAQRVATGKTCEFLYSRILITIFHPFQVIGSKASPAVRHAPTAQPDGAVPKDFSIASFTRNYPQMPIRTLSGSRRHPVIPTACPPDHSVIIPNAAPIAQPIVKLT